MIKDTYGGGLRACPKIKRYEKLANAAALIWRVLMVAERSFRRLGHPELLPELAESAVYEGGVQIIRIQPATEESAA